MTIFAFKTKTEVFEFAENCALNGLGGRVISTPKEVKTGCGFCVVVNARYARGALALVKRGYYPTFYGAFNYVKNGARVSVSRIG